MNRRTLSLHAERLTELSQGELAEVVGAAPAGDGDELPTTPPAYCLTLAGSRCIY